MARHRHMPEVLVPTHKQAWKFMQGIFSEEGFPLRLTVENSRIIEVMAGGRNITEEVRDFSNKKLDLLLVEMAISNNPSLRADELDWSINSVLNEGAKGLCPKKSFQT